MRVPVLIVCLVALAIAGCEDGGGTGDAEPAPSDTADLKRAAEELRETVADGLGVENIADACGQTTSPFPCRFVELSMRTPAEAELVLEPDRTSPAGNDPPPVADTGDTVFGFLIAERTLPEVRTIIVVDTERTELGSYRRADHPLAGIDQQN